MNGPPLFLLFLEGLVAHLLELIIAEFADFEALGLLVGVAWILSLLYFHELATWTDFGESSRDRELFSDFLSMGSRIGGVFLYVEVHLWFFSRLLNKPSCLIIWK